MVNFPRYNIFEISCHVNLFNFGQNEFFEIFKCVIWYVVKAQNIKESTLLGGMRSILNVIRETLESVHNIRNDILS